MFANTNIPICPARFPIFPYPFIYSHIFPYNICMSSSTDNPRKSNELEQNIIYDFIKNQFQVNCQSLPASSITSRDVEAKHTRSQAEHVGIGQAQSKYLLSLYAHDVKPYVPLCRNIYCDISYYCVRQEGTNEMSAIEAKGTVSQALHTPEKKNNISEGDNESNFSLYFQLCAPVSSPKKG